MRFLIDNSISPMVAAALAAHGHDAVHVRDFGMAAAPDENVFDRAAMDDRIVVAADTDFGTILAFRQSDKPSVILFRGLSTTPPDDLARLLLANLAGIEPDLAAGSITVISPRRIRVRKLPIV